MRTYYGITLTRSNNNVVTGNIIETSSSPWISYDPVAILLAGRTPADFNGSSSNNLFYNNAILSSYDKVIVRAGSGNRWDNGEIGNYWSDYSTRYPNATEIGNSGIGNTPYTIDTNNIDRYPIIIPIETLVPTPTVPELSWLIPLPLFATMLFVAQLLKHCLNKKP
jgi:nitrous oxidase accessory protein NosD